MRISLKTPKSDKHVELLNVDKHVVIFLQEFDKQQRGVITFYMLIVFSIWNPLNP